MEEKIGIILKIAIIVAVLIIAGSVFYYFMIFLPEKKQTKLELQRQEQEKQVEHVFSKRQECQELGQKYYKDLKEGLSKYTSLSLPQYAYNERLNTCLIFYMSWGEAIIHSVVRDILTNEVLLSHAYIIIDGKRTYILSEKEKIITRCTDNCTLSDNSMSEFEEKKAELFSQ